jgi:ketosteroid isomerase-like protein
VKPQAIDDEYREEKTVETKEIGEATNQTAEAGKDTTSPNVELVREVYEAFGRGDIATIFGLAHPGIEIYQSCRLPWGGRYKGLEGFGEFLAKLTGAIESEVESGRFIDDEEGHVVQTGRTRGKVKASGERFDVPETHVWTILDGKVRGFESYIDTKKMREVLGL